MAVVRDWGSGCLGVDFLLSVHTPRLFVRTVLVDLLGLAVPLLGMFLAVLVTRKGN